MNLPPPPPRSEHGKELPLSGYKQKRLQAEQQKKRFQQQWKDQALALAVMGVPILLFAGCVKLVGSNSDTSGVMAEFGPFTEAQARLFCKDEMKRKLRDPGSLRIEDVRITSQDCHLGTAAIDYQAKNGFGGTNRSTAICEKIREPKRLRQGLHQGQPLAHLCFSPKRVMRGTLPPRDGGPMQNKLFWLCFKVGHDYKLSPHWSESRQEALRHGMEHVLDRELVAVFSDDIGFSFEEILDLAHVMPRPGSVFLRPPDEWEL